MNLIKKIFTIICTCFALIMNILHAQDSAPKMPEPKVLAEKEVEMMTKDLSLTGEQAKKITPIALKYAEKRKEVSEEGLNTGDWSGIGAKMEKLSQEKDGELKPILTEVQYVEDQKFKKKMRAKFSRRQ
jgi:hypothetical protein